MFVCVCMAVTQQVVEGVIAEGAHTREAVTKACRAGGDCGACHGMIEEMIEDHLEACGGRRGVSACPAPASGERLVAPERLVRDNDRAA